jgi:hypothetical protein
LPGWHGWLQNMQLIIPDRIEKSERTGEDSETLCVFVHAVQSVCKLKLLKYSYND